ncbi:MAG: 3-dehydroquinate synthase [Paludibacteraceae bacterium]|nr:3-dehydroquinate synthase [Paludibacteraceae bacterium]
MRKQKIILSDHFEDDMNYLLEDRNSDDIFILCDEKTVKCCLPRMLDSCAHLKNRPVCVIGAGDVYKHMDTLSEVWMYLSKNGATRRSVLLNLGGGMVTDLGGFAASTFKRGISYINIPTTLLGSVDAAVGGKTGINFNGLKNEIGVFNPSDAVIIDTQFFSTLDYPNLVSGLAEMLKHGLLSSYEEWERLISFDRELFDLKELRTLIRDSIAVKERIVAQDPNEQNIRKALNFGHTFGHAFESFSHEKREPALHGYAVAWGMIPELYLSHVVSGFPKSVLRDAVNIFRETYGALEIKCDDYNHIYELMLHDKKNIKKGEINFTLLGDIGEIQINQKISRGLIDESLDFYRDSVGL